MRLFRILSSTTDFIKKLTCYIWWVFLIDDKRFGRLNVCPQLHADR